MTPVQSLPYDISSSGLSPKNPLIFAIPKGRIGKELLPIFAKIGLDPEPDFHDEACRKLRFKTNHPAVDIIRVRSFDVATFIAFNAAHIGVVGRDVTMEFCYPNIISPVDLDIGHCRISLAHLEHVAPPRSGQGHITVATKYPNITKKHFAQHNVQAEIIKLNGAMELAPSMQLADYIVDLVSTGSTLRCNHLIESEKIADIHSQLIVNKTSYKIYAPFIHLIIQQFEDYVS